MREKLIEILWSVYYLGGLEELLADKLIANDVVPVVRCKDCKHHHYICPAGFLDRNEDDFCSLAEKGKTMDKLISRKALLAEYDRVHVGEPGGARKLMEDAPTINAVEIPCKIGDDVWGIKKFNHGVKVCKGTVYQMYIVEDMKLSIVVRGVGCGEWGRNIFATKEEAEAKILERKENK